MWFLYGDSFYMGVCNAKMVYGSGVVIFFLCVDGSIVIGIWSQTGELS